MQDLGQMIMQIMLMNRMFPKEKTTEETAETPLPQNKMPGANPMGQAQSQLGGNSDYMQKLINYMRLIGRV